MKVTIGSKFEVGDKVKCFHEYCVVTKVTYWDGDGKFNYLLEHKNGERIWHFEENIESVDE